MEGAEEARPVAEGFFPVDGIHFAEEEAGEGALDRLQEIVAQVFPKLGKDLAPIEPLPLWKKAIPLDPEETASPPKIVHVGLASNK